MGHRTMEAPRNIWLDVHYFPSIPYMRLIGRATALYLAVDQPYQKQSYQSRCHIRTAQGLQRLIIPTRHPRTALCHRDIRIDYATPWRRHHWRALTTAYHATPYGAMLAEIYRPFFDRKPAFLLDLTLPLLESTLQLLKRTPRIYLVDKEQLPPDCLDLCHTIHPKRPLPPHLPPPLTYTQRFAPFIPHLSIVDFIACEGIEFPSLAATHPT